MRNLHLIFVLVGAAGVGQGCVMPDSEIVAPFDRPLPDEAHLLIRARTDLILGTQIDSNRAVRPGASESGIAIENGLDSFARIVQNVEASSIENVVLRLAARFFGLEERAFASVKVRGIDLVKTKTGFVRQEAPGHYLWQLWTLSDATLVLSPEARTALRSDAHKLITDQVRAVRSTFDEGRGVIEISHKSGLALAYAVVGIRSIEQTQARSIALLSEFARQYIGLGYSVGIVKRELNGGAAELFVINTHSRMNASRVLTLLDRSESVFEYSAEDLVGVGPVGHTRPGFETYQTEGRDVDPKRVVYVRDRLVIERDKNNPDQAIVVLQRSRVVLRKSDQTVP